MVVVVTKKTRRERERERCDEVSYVCDVMGVLVVL